MTSDGRPAKDATFCVNYKKARHKQRELLGLRTSVVRLDLLVDLLLRHPDKMAAKDLMHGSVAHPRTLRSGLSQLRTAGLIDEQKDPGDRRRKHYKLSALGLSTIREYVDEITALQAPTRGRR